LSVERTGNGSHHASRSSADDDCVKMVHLCHPFRDKFGQGLIVNFSDGILSTNEQLNNRFNLGVVIHFQSNLICLSVS
ncbi:hypothetical protein, partial [Streptococcus gordonii]|uniref:hypothetical protein n=1 Tax=Streptococcus gordonii TaxID=1302 RepID=UPI003BF5CA65